MLAATSSCRSGSQKRRCLVLGIASLKRGEGRESRGNPPVPGKSSRAAAGGVCRGVGSWRFTERGPVHKLKLCSDHPTAPCTRLAMCRWQRGPALVLVIHMLPSPMPSGWVHVGQCASAMLAWAEGGWQGAGEARVLHNAYALSLPRQGSLCALHSRQQPQPVPSRDKTPVTSARHAASPSSHALGAARWLCPR